MTEEKLDDKIRRSSYVDINIKLREQLTYVLSEETCEELVCQKLSLANA